MGVGSYKVLIEVRGGKGGDGLVSFRHFPKKPKGGPDGGDGGNGGGVYIEASENFYSLEHLSCFASLKAEDGEIGGKEKRHGRNGNDLIIKVPVGTAIYEGDEKSLIADLVEPKQKVKIAKGGKGGKGNASFATSTNHIPKIATPGEPGETKKILLIFSPKVKVAVIGPPNVGKSSLIATLTGKKIDVAPYPFSTKKPHLWTHIHNFERYTFLDTPPFVPETFEEIKILTKRAEILLIVFDSSELKNFKEIEVMAEDFLKENRDKKIAIVLSKIDKTDQIPSFISSYPIFPLSTETEKGMDKLRKFIFGKE
ncbi:MAG: GTPase [candidate division WOR-3 bacterium]